MQAMVTLRPNTWGYLHKVTLRNKNLDQLWEVVSTWLAEEKFRNDRVKAGVGLWYDYETLRYVRIVADASYRERSVRSKGA